MNIGTNPSQPLVAKKLRRFSSPPSAQQTEISQIPTDTVTFSGAKARSGPGLSTLKKLGIGVALTAAVGGAFVAGVQFQQPEEPPTFENQMENLGRKLDRGWEDLQIDLKRAGEDFETGFERGYEDAQSGTSRKAERQREQEDIQREWKRKTEDFGRDLSRKWDDLWN